MGKRRRVLRGFLTVAVIYTVAFAAAVGSLPERFMLIEGKEQSFSWNLPIKAEFSDESIAVMSSDVERVNGNITLDLNENFVVNPSTQGDTLVKLKLFGVIPLKTVSLSVIPNINLVPCGNIVGVHLLTEGVMVLGTGKVDGLSSPAEGVLKSGDLILRVDDWEMESKEDLVLALNINGSREKEFVVLRDGKETELKVIPKEASDGTYKIGAWVRDSAQGIGTLTYYEPATGGFGALGHGIYDVDTGQLMSLKEGHLTEAILTGIKKGEKGEPGELMGNLIKTNVIGEILLNSEYGLYGTLDSAELPKESMPIALKQEIEPGPAVIRTDVADGTVQDYTVEIDSVNRYNTSPDKGMVLKVTDERLLNATNGIVQGMSGSPIIQNGKIIGAVTHVFVKDPTKGYGIFIENMLTAESEAAAA